MSYLVCAQLQEDIHILMVLEDVLKLYYVRMMQGFVDLYLGYELPHASQVTF